MAKFMDVHRDMQGITKEQLAAAHRADQAIEREEGVRFERAWADPKAGVVLLPVGGALGGRRQADPRAGGASAHGSAPGDDGGLLTPRSGGPRAMAGPAG
nr:nickel-binding protein [Streptomyces cinnamoneus]